MTDEMNLTHNERSMFKYLGGLVSGYCGGNGSHSECSGRVEFVAQAGTTECVCSCHSRSKYTGALTASLRVEALRLKGWAVAVHNDYFKDGESHTFWLFTLPSGLSTRIGRYASGEGKTDTDALDAVEAAVRSIESAQLDDLQSVDRDTCGKFCGNKYDTDDHCTKDAGHPGPCREGKS